MGYSYKYVVPSMTEPQSPQEQFSVADDIQVRRSLASGLGSATDLFIYEAFGTVVPTANNCPLPCPATYTLTDATTSKFYVATGTPGSTCTGWTEIT